MIPNRTRMESTANAIGTNMFEGFEPTKELIQLYVGWKTGIISETDFLANIEDKKILIAYQSLKVSKRVEELFEKEKPELVIVAAAKVGGIVANNTYRAQFIYENLMIEANIIHAAHKNNVEKLIFLSETRAKNKK